MRLNIFRLRNMALAAAAAGVFPMAAGVVAHFPMEVKSGTITEKISGKSFDVKGVFPGDAVAGAVGDALLFDGYSTKVDARLDNLFAGDPKSMTVSLWVAVPCYPIVEIDVNTKEKATIVSCVDDDAKKGFGFYLGIDGKVEYCIYTGGWKMSVESSKAISPYEWNNLTAVLDADARQLRLYCNGEEVGSSRCNGRVETFSGDLRFGHGGATDRKAGMFNLQAFNGVIDELQIWDEALSPETIAAMKSENECDLSIPASRFAEQKLRPRFHGMPGAAWTNESHGMTRSEDGRYHVFFQKNGNGPYMARLHWGHISSSNLFDWREEKIAFAPGEDYDFKGCWSGAVFSDKELTGGKPSIIYTAVDYAKATIAQADPVDATLMEWKKKENNPLINGRPAGLSDDFRDPYFFRNGDKAYIIVGTSKDNKGAATLHRYSGGRWSNDGSVFFASTNASLSGRFWEMPNVTNIDGKWLFTATPLDMTGGVRTIYWTGDINSDGTFAPDSKSSWPRQVELISKEGYGLLSPTIYQEEGKTIVLGIVPDKLPGAVNYELGWAHCYSLPREWSIDGDGNLSQKPYEGLKAMRAQGGYSKEGFDLTGVETLSPVSGRQAELLMVAEADSSEFGFKIFKGSNGEGKVSIDATNSRLTVDVSGLERHHNDDGVFSGVYTCSLPQTLRKGEDVTLNVFIDGSILDIFINNRWATSIRVFPTAADADGIEAFATAPTKVKSLNAWTLKGSDVSGITDILSPDWNGFPSQDVYTLDGMLIRSVCGSSDPLAGLPKGTYIVGGKKVMK